MSAGGRLARAALLAALAGTAVLVAACGPGDRGAASATRRELGPQWQDVFEGTPEIFAVLRPQAIKRDAVYGSLFKAVLRMAQARTEMRGDTTIQAIEGCEEIIVGLHKDSKDSGHGDDAAMVLRGVPANLDPQKMTDAAGQPAFRLVDPRARVPEYEWIDRKTTGAVFVLPDRTWVGVIGEARTRARQAFAAPFGRPAPRVDPEALATVRFEAATFLDNPRVARSQLLGPLTRKLRAVTLALMPAKAGVVGTLQYADEDASAWAELHLKRIFDEVGHIDPGAPAPEVPPAAAARPGASPPAPPPARRRPSLAWLLDAKVGHEGSAVTVRVAIPARLLEELPGASSADIPL